MSGASVQDVAKWMFERVKMQPLYQDDAAWRIRRRFGKEFVYNNQHGNPAIEKDVLDEFRELSGDKIVWSRGQKLWRERISSDEPGRQQE